MTAFAGRSVMVVEDIFDLAMEIGEILQDAGAEVIGPFATGAIAHDSLQRQTPDCAVLDVNLATGTSFDLARELRSRGVPFLFLTGYEQGVLPAEFSDVKRQEKPVNSARLLETLELCCSRGRA